jgi:hypothetical protein
VGALGDSSLLAYRLAHPLEFPSGLSVEIDDVVERVGNLPGNANLGHRHLDREVALANRSQDRQELIGIQDIVGHRGAAGGTATALLAVGRCPTIAGHLLSRHGNS